MIPADAELIAQLLAEPVDRSTCIAAAERIQDLGDKCARLEQERDALLHTTVSQSGSFNTLFEIYKELSTRNEDLEDAFAKAKEVVNSMTTSQAALALNRIFDLYDISGE